MMKNFFITFCVFSSLACFAAAESIEMSSRALQQAKKVAKTEVELRPAHALALSVMAAKKYKATHASNSSGRASSALVKE